MSELNRATGAVVYTDGSARPNPGFFGSGVHGYTYMPTDEKNKETKIGVWVATEKGYVLQRDLEAADTKTVCVLNYFESFAASEYEGTNNLGEIGAVSLFFEAFPEIVEQVGQLYILADSQYTLNGLNHWVAGWMKNNWFTGQGVPVKNREAWETAYGHVARFKARGQIELAWVHGHNDDLGNVKADYLAGIATNHSTGGHATKFVKTFDPLRYHKADVEMHPLLGLKRIYFNTDPDFNTLGVYYQTGSPEITGKRTPDATFSVVELVNPDPILEQVFQAQYQTPSDYNSIVYLKIDRIRSADVFPWLRDHGCFCLNKDKRNMNLNFLDKKPITLEIRPGELPLRTVDVLNHLEEVLGKFKKEYLVDGSFEPGALQYRIHDVTEHFYDLGSKKVGKNQVETKTLKPEFKVGIRSTEVLVNEDVHGDMVDFKLPLVFMDDIPGRNTLKRLEELDPKVFLITWRESEHLLRYSTVVQTSDALGIWSNFFANQLMI